MSKPNETGELGAEYRVECPVNVVLTNAMFRCTRCRRWKPAAQFGLRCVSAKDESGDEVDIIRNQPQCAECRSRRPALRRVK